MCVCVRVSRSTCSITADTDIHATHTQVYIYMSHAEGHMYHCTFICTNCICTSPCQLSLQLFTHTLSYTHTHGIHYIQTYMHSSYLHTYIHAIHTYTPYIHTQPHTYIHTYIHTHVIIRTLCFSCLLFHIQIHMHT